MTRTRALLPVLAAALLAAPGCIAHRPARASSMQHLRPAEARLRLPLPSRKVVPEVTRTFELRGFPLVQRVPVTPAVDWYVYKGSRQSLTTIRGNQSVVVSDSNTIGSWFAVRVAEDDLGTELLVLGKPTVNGTALCSDADAELAEAEYWCRDSSARVDWPGWPLISGREEAEVVRGVLLTLEQKLRGG